MLALGRLWQQHPPYCASWRASPPAKSLRGEIAKNALESFVERGGMILADWDPHRSRPKLPIVGEAT